MNILFLDSIDKETYGGMEEWIKLVSDGLTARGHTVAVAGRTGSRFLRRIAANTTVPTLELDISGDFHPETIAKIKRYLEENNIDLLVVNFNKDVRLGGLAARLTRDVRVVWSVGLDITKDSVVHKWLTPKLIDGVIVPSESLKSQITQLGYIKEEIVNVIPIGIPDRPFKRPDPAAADALRKKYHLPKDAVVAVTTARFVEQKGHVHLIDAASELIGAFPKLRFLLLGSGPLEESLRNRMKATGVDNNFAFAGMLDDVDAELAGADLMVHPSIEEPFGIAVLEGMRAGLPIVASRVGGIPEVVGEDDVALMTRPGSPDSLVNAVSKLAGDADLRAYMGQRARRRFEMEFQAETMFERIENYLQSIAREAAHGKT